MYVHNNHVLSALCVPAELLPRYYISPDVSDPNPAIYDKAKPLGMIVVRTHLFLIRPLNIDCEVPYTPPPL